MNALEARRRLLLMGVEDMVATKTGSFVGDHGYAVDINIGFAPDILVIESNVDYTQSGWYGIGHCVFHKGLFSVIIRHTSNTSVAEQTNFNTFTGSEGDYGTEADAGSYQVYATYSDGVFHIKNKSRSGDGIRFMLGRNYTWTAYKK